MTTRHIRHGRRARGAAALAARGLATALTLGLTMGLTLGLAAGPLAAQDLVPSAGVQRAPILIENAVVHAVSEAAGVIDGGHVLFEDGVITSVGPGTVDPGGAIVIDAGGRRVYPGFVLATSRLGLVEVGAVDMTLDYNEAGSITPEVVAAVAVNPDSTLIPVTRRNGVLTALAMPWGGRVPGRASVLRLDGWTNESMAMVSDAGLVVSWPGVEFGDGADPTHTAPGERSDGQKALAELDALFDAARAYFAAREADPTVATDLRLEALSATLAGATPIFAMASSRAQITSAVHWAQRQGVRLVIVGGRDAASCVDLLARHDVPVAITRAHRLPHRRDLSYASTYELPGVLQAAGVRWCMATSAGDATNARNLPYEAAACVAHGLDPAAALRSVTLSAAEILGVGHRIGSLEVGKAATLFLADGDPFEFATTIQRAFIDGRDVVLQDKQTVLDEKYRTKYRQMGMLPGGN